MIQQSPKRQYYYFYGSTSESTGNGMGTGSSPPQPPASPAVTENDSLVGENLVPTDNEEDLPKTVQSDFQQLLVSHENGNGLHPLEEHPDEQGNNTCFASCFTCYKRFRRSHSETHILFILTGASLVLLVLLVMVLFPLLWNDFSLPTESSVASNPTLSRNAKDFHMVFPEIDRADYGDPISNFIDTTLFDSSLLHQKKGDDDKREFVFPFPTGAFWTNLILPPTADHGLSYPVAVYPYAYKWGDDMLVTSYPAQHRKEQPKAIHDYFFPDLTLGISQQVKARKITAFDALSVTLRFDTAAGDSGGGSYFESYLVQGSPYITIKYSHVSPVIKAFTTFTNVLCPDEQNTDGPRDLKFGVCYSNNNTTQQETSQTTTLHGVQFIIETQEGVRWIVFSTELIGLVFDRRTRTTIVASAADTGKKFSGVLRYAIVPPTQDKQHGSDTVTTQVSSAPDQIVKSTGLQRLIYHAGVYPVSGAVSWSFRSADSDTRSDLVATKTTDAIAGRAATASLDSSSSTTKVKSGRIATVTFNFETRSFAPASSGASGQKPLLMLALPHHAQSLSPSVQLGLDTFDLVFQCIKGPMRPITGSSWSYDEPLPTIGFDGDSSSGSNDKKLYLNPNVRAKIIDNLQNDIKIALPTATENIYGFGKQAARLAQIAHIATVLQNGNSTRAPWIKKSGEKLPAAVDEYDVEASTVLMQAEKSLRDALQGFLRSRVSDMLVYDANLGGMVTTDGLRDSNADFGNGRYNDHLFHNGYLLYACAIMGKLDASFVKEYGEAVDAIYYDVANDSNFDSSEALGVFFPGARHKSWFDGHSFASGMFHFGNGKSMESSSEAVNCYYGAYLWSLVRNGSADNHALDVSPQTDFARLLLATEIRGARTYWHMMSPESKNKTSSLPSVYSPEFSSNYMVGNLGMLDALCSTWFGTETLYVHMINFLPVTSATGLLFDSAYVMEEYKEALKPLGEVDTAWQGYVIANQAIVEPNAAWIKAEKQFSPTMDAGLSKSQLLYWISTRTGFKASSVPAEGSSSVPSSHSQRGRDHDDDGNATSSCSVAPACAKAGLTGDCCPTLNGVFLGCCRK